MGGRIGAALEESRRQAGKDDARSQARTRDRRLPSLGSRASEGRREERRHAAGVGIVFVGHGWRGRWRLAADSIRLEGSESAEAARKRRQQYWTISRVACAEPSPGVRAHHVPARRPCCEVEHGYLRLREEEHRFARSAIED